LDKQNHLITEMSDYNKNIFDELNALSPELAKIPRLNPFAIPEGYFETSPLELSRKRLLNEDNRLLPAGYFDQLPEMIIHQIRSQSVPNASQLESGISGQSHWQIPDTYFDGLADEILLKARRESTPSKAMTGKVFFMRYAFAAALTGLLGLSLFSLMNQPVDNGDLRLIMQEANRIMENRSLEQAFNTLHEEEIVSFLEQNGHDVETALVATVASQSELPEEIEYLSNENTLDEFLKEMKIQSSPN